jgi:impB/mucB/samB family C-terminal domain
LTERLGRRLRRRGLIARQLRVETTYADYTAGSRTVPLRAAVLDAELWDATRRAFVLANTKRLAVRAVVLTLDRLMEEEAQLEIWDGKRESGKAGKPQHTKAEPSQAYDLPSSSLARCPAALQHALDHIRTRYGTRAVRGGPLTSNLSPLTSYLSPLTSHQATTIFPNVALPSMTRCASAS